MPEGSGRNPVFDHLKTAKKNIFSCLTCPKGETPTGGVVWKHTGHCFWRCSAHVADPFWRCSAHVTVFWCSGFVFLLPFWRCSAHVTPPKMEKQIHFQFPYTSNNFPYFVFFGVGLVIFLSFLWELSWNSCSVVGLAILFLPLPGGVGLGELLFCCFLFVFFHFASYKFPLTNPQWNTTQLYVVCSCCPATSLNYLV